jgi:hypothetical protein
MADSVCQIEFYNSVIVPETGYDSGNQEGRIVNLTISLRQPFYEKGNITTYFQQAEL